MIWSATKSTSCRLMHVRVCAFFLKPRKCVLTHLLRLALELGFDFRIYAHFRGF